MTRSPRTESEPAWEEDDEVVKVEVKRSLDKVVPVRLSSDRWEVLRKEAAELGIGPSTLVRMWILEKLRSLKTQEETSQVVASMTQVKASTISSLRGTGQGRKKTVVSRAH